MYDKCIFEPLKCPPSPRELTRLEKRRFLVDEVENHTDEAGFQRRLTRYRGEAALADTFYDEALPSRRDPSGQPAPGTVRERAGPHFSLRTCILHCGYAFSFTNPEEHTVFHCEKKYLYLRKYILLVCTV